ncbi:MAG: arabinan endo-1,5-alpha-L-arabinosidase [Lachnospiraceae bacterium]|nr:arabinan endo-1,5-alpha-L-arabinosidase [Lachnospiraceae bacterium]
MAEYIYPDKPPIAAPKPLPIQHDPHKPPVWEPLPDNSLWFTHDPAVFHDPVSGNYYTYNTDGSCKRSTDLVSWTHLGVVVDGVPKAASDHTGSTNIWAPDIAYVNGEYRLYCSNSSWGSQNSCIFMAVADNAEGPFIPKDVVFKSDSSVIVNAIDANIATDHKTGEQYLVYGSFYDGCYILKLDKETGLAAEEGVGHCICHRPLWLDGAVEGPYIIYNEATDYYYLFVSYGSLHNDYNIRVGRSKNIEGPYLDHNDRPMTDLDDPDCTLGYMLYAGYHFDETKGFMAPGHNSVLHDFDGEWYVVNHIRPYNFVIGDIPVMQVRKMLWTNEGWPVVSPCTYANEKVQPVTPDMIPGRWEKVVFAPLCPQNVTNSIPLEIFDNGYFNCLITRGQWKLLDDTTIEFTYGPHREVCTVIPAWDADYDKPTLCFTGTNEKNIAVWGKKR